MLNKKQQMKHPNATMGMCVFITESAFLILQCRFIE